jgi:hypothetical protein
MKKSKHPKRPRASNKRKRKLAVQREEPQHDSSGVFSDGSKILIDQGGHIIGLVEARPAYTIKPGKRPKG